MNDLGLKFRSAAAEGNVRAMQELYQQPALAVTEAGPKTGKTAAHRAAENGKASVLRFLHNCGDTFTAVDKEGKTPAELAKEPECVKIFELVKQGKKAVEAAKQVFFLDNQAGGANGVMAPFIDASVIDFRAKLMDLSKMDLDRSMEQLMSCAVREEIRIDKGRATSTKTLPDWIRVNALPLLQHYYMYHVIDQADKMGQTFAKCGEQSLVAYAYLTAVLKTKAVAELLSSRQFRKDSKKGQPSPLQFNSNPLKWSHAFVLLNRNSRYSFEDYEGWKEALIVDPLEGRTFFYEHFGILKDNPMFKKAKELGPDILCSTLCPPFYKNGEEPTETESLFRAKKLEILDKIAARLTEVMEKRSTDEGLDGVTTALLSRLMSNVALVQ